MTQDQLAILEVVHNWALWRDAGDWDRFATVWHDDGWMTATWFQGPAREFIKVSKAGFEKGVSILHFLGGSTIEVNRQRAIAQTARWSPGSAASWGATRSRARAKSRRAVSSSPTISRAFPARTSE